MKHTFFLLVLSIFCMACTSKNEQEANPIATESESYSIGWRGDNLVESLYEQRPELERLDKRIQEVDESKNKALENYKLYNGKNEQYYSTAGQYLNSIQDSLLRNSIELLLNKSQYAYDQENAAMALAAATLENRSTSLHDHQQALKIILTMDLMEKYQKRQVPDAVKHQKIIDRYNETIRSADSLLQAK
jgi:hypothetical protein